MATFNQAVDFRLTANDAASPVLRGVETSLGRVQKSYQQLIGVLGVGLSVGYFVSLIKGSIDAMDRLHDLTLTIKGLSSETLAGLGIAAKQAGATLMARPSR